MREPFTQVYIHFVWATWDREPLLAQDLEPQVYACIQATCRELKADVIALGGIEDHVHLLVRVPMTVPLSTLIQRVKGASSHLVTQVLAPDRTFKWQGAYGAFAVSASLVPIVREYILNQRRHHDEGTLNADLELLESRGAGE